MQKATKARRMTGIEADIFVEVKNGDAVPRDRRQSAQRGENFELRRTRGNHKRRCVQAIACGAKCLRGELRRRLTESITMVVNGNLQFRH